jgi:hypothetical protein
MAEASASGLRAELRAALSVNTDRLGDAIRADLARPIRLDEGRSLRFEIDPFSFGIFSCATEEVLLSDDWLDDALPEDWFERAEAAEGGWIEMISEELCPWFADCWATAGGPTRFSPAFLFFHGHHLVQFDLERRRWLSSAEASGG